MYKKIKNRFNGDLIDMERIERITVHALQSKMSYQKHDALWEIAKELGINPEKDLQYVNPPSYFKK